MAKLLIFVTLVTLTVIAQGMSIGGKGILPKLKLQKFLSRHDPFPEPRTPPPSTSNIVAGLATQRLDHFDPTNDQTWEQPYVMTAEHFEPGGCIFLFLSGEWSITEYRLENSVMAEMAADFNCYIFYLQHRYYGESRPTPNITDENLRWLTVEQALADTAHFVQFIQSSEDFPGAGDAPVVVIGGQYSASLAAWFRQSYPHLAVGAWASSAPMLAVYNQFQFKELTGAVYRHIGGNACYQNIENGFAEMEQMVADGRNAEISAMFHLCNIFDDPFDVQLFFSLMSEVFSLLAQFDQYTNVAGVCQLLANETHTSDAAAIAAVIVYLIDEIGEGEECIDIDYQVAIEAERQTNWDYPSNEFGLRQYTYQLCTQLGWYHSSDSRFQPFGSSFSADFRHVACGDIFDFTSRELLVSNIERFNTVRGGLNPGATNVLYVHGQLDPTRSIGIQTTDHPTSPAIVIAGASQGNDLGPTTDDDSAALAAAKLQVREIISGWIGDDADDIAA